MSQDEPTPTMAEMTAKYNAIHASLDSMGKALLKLMRHPDSTAEQMDEGRLKYFLAYKRWIEARMLLREKYPPRFLQREIPWNEEEDL